MAYRTRGWPGDWAEYSFYDHSKLMHPPAPFEYHTVEEEMEIDEEEE